LNDKPLAGKKIAILVAAGFEEMEMTEIQRAVLKMGAVPHTVSTDQGLVNGWFGKGWGHYFPVDRQINDVLGADYDMLLLPGGERSIAKLSRTAHTRRIVGHFLDAGKPIAAIDQGVSLLAVPGKLRKREIAARDEYHEALIAAGGEISSESLSVHDVTVTARSDEDLESFIAETLRVFAEAAQIREAA